MSTIIINSLVRFLCDADIFFIIKRKNSKENGSKLENENNEDRICDLFLYLIINFYFFL